MKKVVLHPGQMLLYESARNFKIDFNLKRTYLKRSPLYITSCLYGSILNVIKDYHMDDLRTWWETFTPTFLYILSPVTYLGSQKTIYGNMNKIQFDRTQCFIRIR